MTFRFFTTALFSIISLSVAAQEAAPTFMDKNETTLALYTIVIGLTLVVVIVLTLSFMLLNMAKAMYRDMLIEKGYLKEETEEAPAWENQLMHSLTQAVPIEKEGEIDLGHEYDGIRELDNRLPPWWVWMFYITTAWAIGYMIYYHVLEKGPLQIEEYEIAMEKAELQKESFLAKAADQVNENTVVALTAESDINRGKQLYTINCVACHGASGEGTVGPNLTDGYWVHGGGVKNIFKVIKYGVPEKGMIAWQTQLKPSEIQQITSYILTLQGTNPPNGKAPEGTLYVEEKDVEAAKPAESEDNGA